MTEQEMLDELLELESGLSEWEIGFIDNMAVQLERKQKLTLKQHDKLKEIWRKRYLEDDGHLRDEIEESSHD